MTYKTHPYFKLGIFPVDLRKTYEVDENEVRLINHFGSGASAKTKNVSTAVKATLLQKINGNGNIEIYESGSLRFTFEKVRNVTALLNAIDQAQNPQAPEPPPAPWYEAETFDNDNTILIPAIPSIIYKRLAKKAPFIDFFKWRVEDGDFVEAEQIVATMDLPATKSAYQTDEGKTITADITSPFNGKIRLGQTLSFDWPDEDYQSDYFETKKLIKKPENALFRLTLPDSETNKRFLSPEFRTHSPCINLYEAVYKSLIKYAYSSIPNSEVYGKNGLKPRLEQLANADTCVLENRTTNDLLPPAAPQ